MFCPRCATQNELKRGYCRQCGQALSGVRLALEGSSDKSLEKLKAAEEWIKGGSATLLVFTLIALVIAILGIALHDLSFGYIAFFNLLLGAFVGLPLVYFGKAKMKRAIRLLSKSQSEPSYSVLDQAQRQDSLPAAGLNEESLRLAPQDSVTEHTTLNLPRSEHNRRMPG